MPHAHKITPQEALQRTIENHERKITAMNRTLERQREQMLKQFAQLETIVAKMQASLTSLSRLQPLPFLAAQRSN